MGAFSQVKKAGMSCSSFLPSLVARAGHQLLVLVLAHFFLSFLDHTSHSITSVLSVFLFTKPCFYNMSP
jgi:hypothetical protein